jgi:UPF0755 protein
MKKRTSCLTSIIIISLGLLCVIVLAGVAAVDLAPRTAAEDFGPPAPGMDRFQKAINSLQLLLHKDALLAPVDPTGNPITFEIKAGESVNSIALNLENAGLIRDAGSFRLYLIYAGMDTSIQAGEYRLSPSQNAVGIAQAIQDATPKEATLRILAGWRLEEVAAALPTTGLSITPDDFLRLARSTFGEDILPGHPELQNVEGFLFPDTYKFERSASAAKVLAVLLQNFDARVPQELRQAFERQGLTLEEAVTLASIVQKEAIVPDEQPIIASVFFNRLHDGMKLDSDPTVQYALGYIQATKTWWKNPLSANDLTIQSPYNTYMNKGLPPGPICNPGLTALQAVAYPAETPYYFFRARCDGSGRHNFARTYEEQVGNACP